MKLIAEKRGKSDKVDLLRFIRADGSETYCAMPRQGTLPHDLIHYVVESALPLRHGFLSLVACGSDVGFVMQTVHDPSNRTLETDAVHAEAIVEALQTQLWAGAFEREAFLQAAQLAATSRGYLAFDFGHFDQALLYDWALQLLEQWIQVPIHQSMQLAFAPGMGLHLANPSNHGRREHANAADAPTKFR